MTLFFKLKRKLCSVNKEQFMQLWFLLCHVVVVVDDDDAVADTDTDVGAISVDNIGVQK